MKRKEFIQLWVETVDAGRQRNFPDITPAERACASVDDANFARNLWRRNRASYAAMTPEQFRATLAKTKESAQ